MVSFDVIMLATPEIDYYAEETRLGWRKYCERHGYAFYCERNRLFEDMHVVWSKVGLLQKQLQASASDWIVLVDADTIVNRPDYSLTKLVESYPNRQVLISEDCSRRFGVPFPLSLQGSRIMGRYRPANTGFVAIRNNAFGKEFVDSWLEYAHGEFADVAKVFPREQMIFWVGLYRDFKHHIAVIGPEVLRIGFDPFWDVLSIFKRNAFVWHDKSLLRWSGSA